MHPSLALFALASIAVMAAPIDDSAVGDYSYRDGWSQTDFPIINLPDRDVRPIELSKRQSYGGPGYRTLYYCNSGGYLLGEGCKEDLPAMGACYNTPGYFTDKLDSLKIGDQMQCDFFDNSNCQPDQGTLPASVIKTGTTQLSQYGFGDRIASYRCYPGNPPA